MQIAVHFDKARLFQWHIAVVEGLVTRGHRVSVSFRDTSEPLAISLTAILDFDRVRTGAGNDRLSTRRRASDLAAMTSAVTDAVDITIDLSTSVAMTTLPGRVLRPHYDGSPGDQDAFAALLRGSAPDICVVDWPSGHHWHVGLPAIEQPNRLGPSFDQVFSRTTEGLLRVIDAIADGGHAPSDGRDHVLRSPQPNDLWPAVQKHARRRFKRKARGAVDRLTQNRPRWHVAWRWTETPIEAVIDEPHEIRLNLSDFRLLPDDGRRFYADPFVLARDGVHHVFVEELPDATGKGVISHTAISRDGSFTPVRVVLERPVHLSYPFVFEHAGEVWMIPESSAAGGVDLYRADPFPHTWTLVQRLITAPLHDATLFQHGGAWWIAAGSASAQSSTWDAVALYTADDLLGPWRTVDKLHLPVDARMSRPAGRLWTRDGALYRPTQDCSEVYGGQLTINRISALTAETISEAVVATAAFTEHKRIKGPHTVNYCNGLEVVDLYARPGDLRAGYRGPGGL